MFEVSWFKNGRHRFEVFLSGLFIEDFVKKLEARGCENIKVEEY